MILFRRILFTSFFMSFLLCLHNNLAFSQTSDLYILNARVVERGKHQANDSIHTDLVLTMQNMHEVGEVRLLMEGENLAWPILDMYLSYRQKDGREFLLLNDTWYKIERNEVIIPVNFTKDDLNNWIRMDCKVRDRAGVELQSFRHQKQ